MIFESEARTEIVVVQLHTCKPIYCSFAPCNDVTNRIEAAPSSLTFQILWLDFEPSAILQNARHKRLYYVLALKRINIGLKASISASSVPTHIRARYIQYNNPRFSLSSLKSPPRRARYTTIGTST